MIFAFRCFSKFVFIVIICACNIVYVSFVPIVLAGLEWFRKEQSEKKMFELKINNRRSRFNALINWWKKQNKWISGLFFCFCFFFVVYVHVTYMPAVAVVPAHKAQNCRNYYARVRTLGKLRMHPPYKYECMQHQFVHRAKCTAPMMFIGLAWWRRWTISDRFDLWFVGPRIGLGHGHIWRWCQRFLLSVFGSNQMIAD